MCLVCVCFCQLPGMVKSDQLARSKEVNLTHLSPIFFLLREREIYAIGKVFIYIQRPYPSKPFTCHSLLLYTRVCVLYYAMQDEDIPQSMHVKERRIYVPTTILVGRHMLCFITHWTPAAKVVIIIHLIQYIEIALEAGSLSSLA